MRRITPLVILMFALAGMGWIILSQIQATANLQANRAEATEYSTRLIEAEIGQFVDELNQITDSRSVRQYSLTLATLPANSSENDSQAVRVAQSELLQRFDDTIRTHRDRVLAMRYLYNNRGTWVRWGEALNASGAVTLKTGQQPYTPLDATTYNLALTTAQPNTPILSDIIRNPDGVNRIVMYMPVFSLDKTELVGLVELELSVQPVINDFGAALKNSIYGSESLREFALLDFSGNLLFDSDEDESLESYQDILASTPLNTTNQISGLDMISVLPVGDYQGEGFPWRLIIKDSLLAPGYRQYGIQFLLIVASVFFCWLSLYLLERVFRQILGPVDEARAMVTKMTADIQGKPYNAPANGKSTSGKPASGIMPAIRSDDGDLDGMVTSIDQAALHIQKLRERLEREDQRHRRDIDIAARIGRETATRSDLNQVLDQAIELICRELGYYHAQVFLTDDVGTNAVLVRSRGEVGRQLIAQGHKIAIGSSTVIGQVVGKGEPVIVNDTKHRGDNPHGFNALLEETNAELGLPLVIQNRVIGALDIQSRTPNAFNVEDMSTFRLLADQVALAVNTARLLNETQQQVHQVESLNRLYTRQSWEQADQQGIQERAYRYNLMNVEAAPLDEPSADKGNGGLALPISLRGEVIGVLSAAASEGQYFTEGDEVVLRAVADRVALAIENARLFQETQINLAETSILYRLSRFLNEATTLDDILQALVVSVMQDADSAQVWIFDEYGDEPEWIEVVADLSYSERDPGNESLVGLRLGVADHPFIRRIRSNQVTLIHDTRNDVRLDAGLQLVFRRIHSRTVVIIPLNVRGEWRGIIMVEYDEPRDFTEREGRIFSALIDQAGVAIDNRLLLEQTESARSRSENLYSASRIINTMQTFKDLVYAVVVTSTGKQDYRLTLLEGELDTTGWPTLGRVVSESRNGLVEEADRVQRLFILPDSPLRRREPLIVRDDLVGVENVSPQIRTLRNDGYRYMATFPLFSANQPVALFSVLSVDLIEMSPEDYEVYRAITGQMSTQLENRRLLDRTEQALDETRRLYAASRAINAAQDSREVYYTTIQHLAGPFLQVTSTEQTIDMMILLSKGTPRWDAAELECVYAWSSDQQAVRL
ncbi:MAG TPA: GAF domain-containing protein, partial [Phototrophicaceae bacterium]|nr:GAF domain-containing protein [Phototrophicaceae bacterium]